MNEPLVVWSFLEYNISPFCILFIYNNIICHIWTSNMGFKGGVSRLSLPPRILVFEYPSREWDRVIILFLTFAFKIFYLNVFFALFHAWNLYQSFFECILKNRIKAILLFVNKELLKWKNCVIFESLNWMIK